MRKTHENGPTPAAILVASAVSPATCLAAAVLAILEVLHGLPLWFWMVLGAFCVALLTARRKQIVHTRREALAFEPASPQDLQLSDLGEEAPAARDPDREAALVEKVVRLLRSRRLVVLRGEPLSARARVALDAFRDPGFSGYKVLRPTGESDPGQHGLTKLLGRGILPRRRYALWLGDLGQRVGAGLDPRIIERWLASGPGRVAIGWITESTNEVIRETKTSAAFALRRAAHVVIDPDPSTGEARALSAYLDARRFAPTVAAFVRVVSCCELLRVGPKSDQVYVDLTRRWTGEAVDAAAIAKTEMGDPAMLARNGDGLLEPHPELAQELTEELNREVDPLLFEALIDVVEADELVFLAQSLALRGHIDQAREAVDRADGRRPGDPQVADTSLWLDEIGDGLEHGPSGVTLGRRGGFDYAEPPGPSQQRASADILRSEGDGVFDPSLPDPAAEGRSQRFYRRAVRRAIMRVGVLMLLDFFAMSTAAAAALSVRAGAGGDPLDVEGSDLWTLAISATLVFWLVAASMGLYQASAARARPQLLLASSAVVSVVAAAGFFVGDVDVGSLTALPVMFGSAFVMSLLLRFLYDIRSRRWVRRNHLAPRVLLLGTATEARSYAENLVSRGTRPVQPVAFLAPSKDDEDPFCAGTYSDLEDRLHELHIAEVVIVDHAASTSDKAELTSRAQGFGADVRFLARDTEVVLGAVGRLSDLGLVHVPGALMSPERLELKRVVDWLLVSVTLPAWAAGVLAYGVYSLIRRPGQPVLVSTERTGLGLISFEMLRLRTRTVHPDGERGLRPTGRIEAFLEKSGLDELPQVGNVLRGEMSLVGPRPISARDVSHLTLDQKRTLAARPGMTGHWQVAWHVGASEEDRRAFDAYYLRRWRLSLDFEILLRTPLAILRRRRYLGDTEIARRRGDPAGPDLRLPLDR